MNGWLICLQKRDLEMKTMFISTDSAETSVQTAALSSDNVFELDVNKVVDQNQVLVGPILSLMSRELVPFKSFYIIFTSTCILCKSLQI